MPSMNLPPDPSLRTAASAASECGCRANGETMPEPTLIRLVLPRIDEARGRAPHELPSCSQTQPNPYSSALTASLT